MMEFLKRYSLKTALIAAAICALLLIFWQQSKPVSSMGTDPVTIVIDPGHGGEDGGATTADGVRESDLNLDIALRTRDLFALIGSDPRMIRTSDVSVHAPESKTITQKKVSDLKNRVKTINQTPGAMLVSIHQNSYPESKYHGAQVFYAASEESRQLAEHLQTQLVQFLDPDNRRQAKPAAHTIYLMQNISCTGVLVECGFLTNPEEAAKLQDSRYQKQFAAALVGATAGYLEGESASNGEV